MKSNDIVSICNALMDILVEVNESDIQALSLRKGIMHLVNSDAQSKLRQRFADKKTVEELGGSSLNAIRTLSALGAKAAFAGMVGKDEFAKRIKLRMKELGIDSHLLDTEASETGSCYILITPDGERTMNTNLGASVLFDRSLVPFDMIETSRIFHFCGYQWGSSGQIDAIQSAIQHAQTHKTTVSFDVADPFVVEQNRSAFIEVIDNYADIVFANREEASLLYESTPEAACDRICASGSIAVMKLGSEGALIGKDNERVHIRPYPTKVVDTTAAGDMFASGFLYGYAKGASLAMCGEIAALLAGDVISRVGASVSDVAIKKANQLLTTMA